MKLGYTIIYVPHVAESLKFFERAFGLSRRFLHESGDYGEQLFEPFKRVGLQLGKKGIHPPIIRDEIVPMHSAGRQPGN